MAEILLVNAPVRDPSNDAHARASPPLGLGYIAAVLREGGFEVAILDLNLAQSSPEVELSETVLEESPRLVGFSATTESYPQAISLAGLVKEEDQDILTVMGGPHVTFLFREALTAGWVDVVVRGEGEESMLQLARSYRRPTRVWEDIEGISFRENGSIRSTPDRPLIVDLDRLPPPARDLFALEGYQFPGNLVTARGCPARCVFCVSGALARGRYRMRSPEQVVEEMNQLAVAHGLERCTIVDDSFTVCSRRTLRICELLEEWGRPLKWGCSTRVSSVTPALLMRMREAGCEEIQFGVESGSEAVQASLGKDINLSQVHQAVEWAQQAQMEVTCSFMIPHPADTHATVRETRSLMRELARRGARVSVAVTTPFPGTALWERATEWGIEIQSTDWRDYDACTSVFSTPNLSRKDISLIITELLYNGP